MATFVGTNGNDNGTDAPAITGGPANDLLQGLGGDDILNGGQGDNTIIANGGDDRINPASSNDSVLAGDGNDLFVFVINGRDDADTLDEGDGFNEIAAQLSSPDLRGKTFLNIERLSASSTRYDAGQLESFEELTNISIPDQMSGGVTDTAGILISASNNNWITVNLTNVDDDPDTVLAPDATVDILINGSRGDDTVVTGAGNDTLLASAGDDFYNVTDRGDRVIEATGGDHRLHRGDQLALDDRFFGLGDGRVDAREVTASQAAHAIASGTFIYDRLSGEVFVDGDGSRGADAPDLIAIIDGSVRLCADDVQLF